MNHFNTEDGFKCIEDLTDKGIERVFAGSRSCFAVAKCTSATQIYIDEFLAANVTMKPTVKLYDI